MNVDQAVSTWQTASDMPRPAYRSGPAGKAERAAYRQRRDELYADADRLAGSHAALMVELTRRGIICWAF